MEAGMRRAGLNYPFMFVVPVLVIYIFFFIVPTVSGFWFSLTDWNSNSNDIKFVGFRQFSEVLRNPNIAKSAFNTFIYAMETTVFKNLFGLFLAVILNSKIRSKNALRAVFFSPAILNVVAMGLIFQGLLNPFTGFVNNTLRKLGLDALALRWITDPKLAIHCVSAMEVWRATGIAMVIYLAGLQGISREYLEAAEIDGAGKLQVFRYITLPLLAPAITINVLLSLIYGFRMFEVIYFLTQGGPGYASEVIITMAYRYMGMGLFGYSAAINVMLVLFIICISIPILNIMRKQESQDV